VSKRDWYAYGDELMDELRVKINKVFSRSRLIMNFDELNVMDSTKESKRIYRKLDRMNRRYFESLAFYIYFLALAECGETEKERKRKPFDQIAFIESELKQYNPVTKYVYDHEVDRKRARFNESVIADVESANITEVERDYNRAARLWIQQTEQYMVNVEDDATIQAYEDHGVDRVMWITERDERVCEDCQALDGLIFRIDQVPAKPHPRCRCTIRPILR